jgi:hypothetical protein
VPDAGRTEPVEKIRYSAKNMHEFAMNPARLACFGWSDLSNNPSPSP